MCMTNNNNWTYIAKLSSSVEHKANDMRAYIAEYIIYYYILLYYYKVNFVTVL